jgi:hypothetical protein
LNRAYEAHLDGDDVVALLGTGKPNIMDEAGYAGSDQETVLAEYELLDPIAAGTHGQE